MPPRLGTSIGYGRLYWKYSEKDPKWKVLKTYSSDDGMTFECKLTKEEKKMPKFEVGDTVKVVKLDCKWNGWVDDLSKYIGKTGKIKLHDTCGGNVCGVQFKDSADVSDWWSFPEDWLELVEKAKKYWSGTVVCVSSESEAYFVEGKAYKVKDGKIFGEDHFAVQTSKTEPITELNLGDISWCPLMPHDFGGTKFIEYKGMAGE